MIEIKADIPQRPEFIVPEKAGPAFVEKTGIFQAEDYFFTIHGQTSFG